MMRRFFPSTIRVAGGFEPEYIAVLDRATALGYTTPDEPTNIRNNNRVKYLKNTGLWAKFDLLYFFDQPTGLADFAKLNYIDPLLYEAFNANPALEPDFIADSGYKSQGTKFFDTGFNVQTSGVNFIGGNVDGRASVFYRGFDFLANATNETISGARTSSNLNMINILKLTTNTSQLFRLASIQGGQTFTALSNNSHVLLSSAGGNNTLGLLSRVYVNGANNPINNVAIANTFSSLTMYLFATNFNNVAENIARSGLKYFGLAGYLGGTDPNQEAIDLYEIMDDIYVP